MVARDHGGLRQPASNRGPGLTDGDAAPDTRSERADSPGTLMQGDRRKAYRPIPPDRRRYALDTGLAALARGDFFLAHELLEPAWMGTSNQAERALYQGLIKLAAGYVHAVRGNPIGVARNLQGARLFLATSARLDPEVARAAGIDLTVLLAMVDVRLVAVTTAVDDLASARGPLIDLLPPAPRVR